MDALHIDPMNSVNPFTTKVQKAIIHDMKLTLKSQEAPKLIQRFQSMSKSSWGATDIINIFRTYSLDNKSPPQWFIAVCKRSLDLLSHLTFQFGQLKTSDN